MNDYPTNWKETTFGCVFNQRKEGGHPNEELLALTSSTGIVKRDSLERRDTSNEDKSKYLLVQKGDIAYNTMRMWQGVSGVSRFRGIVSPAYTICSPTDELDADFAGYLLKDPSMVSIFRQRSQGLVSDTWNLKYEAFAEIPCTIPPLPEQKKIAEILSGIDRTISIKRQARNDLETTREAICRELIQNGDWTQEEIGDLTNHMTNGFVGTATPHYRERGVRYLTSKNIKRDRIDSSRMIYISEEFHMANQKSSLRVGDVLMVQSGHIGTTAAVTNDYKDCNCHALILMRFNQEHLDPEYASLYFNSAIGKTRLSDIFVGSTVKHVNTGDLRKFKIPVPPLRVQREITNRVNAIDLLLGKRGVQIEKLVILKQAISSDLLSGRKRVSV